MMREEKRQVRRNLLVVWLESARDRGAGGGEGRVPILGAKRWRVLREVLLIVAIFVALTLAGCFIVSLGCSSPIQESAIDAGPCPGDAAWRLCFADAGPPAHVTDDGGPRFCYAAAAVIACDGSTTCATCPGAGREEPCTVGGGVQCVASCSDPVCQ